MVAVDPLDFLRGHYGYVEEAAVEGEERHGLEAEEAAELGGEGVYAEHEVLAADTVAVGAVEAGLVGGEHAGAQRGGHVVEAYALRTFVNVEEVAYAVAGAVEVAQALFPEELARESVELGAARSFGEYGRAEGYVCLLYTSPSPRDA